MMSYALVATSKQQDNGKKKVKPKLKVVPKGTPRRAVNEADFEKPIKQSPAPFDPSKGDWSDALSRGIEAFALIEERVKYIGFTPDQELEIFKRLFMTIFWKPCADAYKAFPGTQATPAEVLQDRGITYVNAPSLVNSNIESELGINSEDRQNLLGRVSGFFGFYFGAGATTRVPEGDSYKLFPNQGVITVVNFGSMDSNLDEDIPHEMVHAVGVPGGKGISGGLSRVNDLSNYGAKYKNVIENCKPLN